MICPYKNCSNRQPGSNLSFFDVPNDSRREIWIKHSGNNSLHDRRGRIRFCEKHFYLKNVVKLGLHKRLINRAIPIPVSGCKCTEDFIDEDCRVNNYLLLNKTFEGCENLNENFRLKNSECDGDKLNFEYVVSSEMVQKETLLKSKVYRVQRKSMAD